MDIVTRLLKNHLYTPKIEDQNRFLTLIDNLIISIEKAYDSNLSFWKQIIKNIKALALTPWHEDLGYRERQMADNLNWLAEEKYPNSKIIVWVASVYSFRNRETINTLNPNLVYDDADSFGDKLQKHFGKNAYTVGFTAHGGDYGAFYWNTQSKKIEEPSNGSLEDLFYKKNIEYGFLNFEENKLTRSYKAKPLGFSEMESIWSNNFDGLFFIRTMYPSTEIKSKTN